MQETAARADGLLEAAGHVLRATGPLGFFKGVHARVLYQMPAAAICWLTYESIKHALAAVSARPSPRAPGLAGAPVSATVLLQAEAGESPAAASGPAAPPLACAALRLAAADVPARS